MRFNDKFDIKEVVKELEKLNDEGKYELHKFDQFEFYSSNLSDKTFKLIDCYCPDEFDEIETEYTAEVIESYYCVDCINLIDDDKIDLEGGNTINNLKFVAHRRG